MPPKMATFVWEKFGLHLGRLLAKCEPYISGKRGLFFDSAPFFPKLLEKRKSFFQNFLKKIGWAPAISPFWAIFTWGPSPSPLLIFSSSRSLALFRGFRFAEIHLIPPFSATFGMSLSFFVSPFLPHPFLLASFPTRAKEDAPPTANFFRKISKNRFALFIEFEKKGCWIELHPFFIRYPQHRLC